MTRTKENTTLAEAADLMPDVLGKMPPANQPIFLRAFGHLTLAQFEGLNKQERDGLMNAAYHELKAAH